MSMLLEHMHKKFEVNRTKIKGGCQSGRKVVTQDSKSDLPVEWDEKCYHASGFEPAITGRTAKIHWSTAT